MEKPVGNHAIFASATTIALMTLIAKLASTGKQMMLASQFGRGDALAALSYCCSRTYF